MIIYLTYPIHPGMFKYPSDPEPEIERIQAELINGKYKSGHTYFKLGSHLGTHIDAPAHKLADGYTIDKYANKKFKNNLCILVDLTNRVLLQRRERKITKKDIEKYLDKYKEKKLGALIFYTGFCDEMAKWNRRLSGEDKKNFEKSFPYFTQEAARYIIEKNPDLNLVGIDSFSVDKSGSNSEVHRIFFGEGKEKAVLPLETLVNLREVKNKFGENVFRLNCEAFIIPGADAAQVRAYAEYPKNEK